MKKIILHISATVFLFYFFLVPLSTAYTESLGLEIGDSARFSYSLKFTNNTLIESNSGFDTQVNYGQLIEGFVDEVEGMKIDEIKNFEVPPEKGYTAGRFEGVILVYEVKLLAVSNPPASSSTQEEANIITTILWVGFWVFLIIVGSGVLFVVYKLTRKKTGAKCIVCGDIYHGTCSKCNEPYCKKDFGMKCQSCGNKMFSRK